ncbi:MAG TPA: non-homologous end-joining DNA ligase [Acidimicrobiia bacterium]|nr:non-homologous end-joining DNA ligase [Acidimicrobiia bacterium]
MRDDLLPMLATPGRAPVGDGWVWELKWDGVRALVHIAAGGVQVRARSGRDITARYPELQGLSEACPGRDATLDGEIVATGDDGLPSFEQLQRRMHVDDPRAVARLVRDVPIAFIAFDLLALDGAELFDEPWSVRRAALDALALDGPAWRTSPFETGDGARTVAFSRAHMMEGVVAKRADSRYVPGQRSRAWIKVKHHRRQEFVVGGWVPGTGSRADTFGALVLGVYDDADAGRVLRCVGKVGTGFSNAHLAWFVGALQQRAIDTSPFGAGAVPRDARFVVPELVVEVRFTEWTSSGTVRHPAFMGVRDDKDPTSVVRET